MDASTMDGLDVGEALARVVTAAYRPIDFAYFLEPAEALAIPDGDGDVGDLAEDILGIVEEIRVPNAMRPVGWSLAGTDVGDGMATAMRGSADRADLWHLFGRDGGFRGAVDTPTFEATYMDQSDGDEVYGCHAFAGDAVEVSGSLAGGFSGQASLDPRGFFANMARVSSTGRYLVAADAPLAVQAASLSDFLDGGAFDDAEEMISVSDHVSHVMILSQALAAIGDGDPGAWIDLSRLAVVMQEVLDPERQALEEPVGRGEVTLDLLQDLDEARRDDPMWRIGGRVEVPPSTWTARDDPASGMEWSRIDADMRSLPSGGVPPMPGNDAQFLVVPTRDDGQVARVRSLLGGGEILCARGRSLVVRDRSRNLCLALLDGGDRMALVAWSVETSAGPRSDPLMAETMAGTLAEPPAAVGREDEAYVEAMDNLADLGLGGILPAPDRMPDYAGMMLLSAHRRGRSLADLCASLARTIRAGAADEAFRHDDGDGDDGGLGDEEALDREGTARRAEAFGGEADVPLTAMLHWIHPEDWAEVDLERDLRMLGDAVAEGLTLEDLSAAVMAGKDDGEGTFGALAVGVGRDDAGRGA